MCAAALFLIPKDERRNTVAGGGGEVNKFGFASTHPGFKGLVLVQSVLRVPAYKAGCIEPHAGAMRLCFWQRSYIIIHYTVLSI